MKNLDNGNLTATQPAALQKLVADRGATADAWAIKEKLRWSQKAPTPRAARWRITNYLKTMREAITNQPLLKPMAKACPSLSGRRSSRW